MAKLQYRTKYNAHPGGKSRVFFCCHPEDHAQCFDAITREILSTHDCAIWYLEDSEKIDNLSKLLLMELFVIPVTSNFLCSRNAALDVYFPFAIKHNIPVLPLMQEPGLEKLFDQKCGDLQLLDRYTPLNEKIDVIKYQNKLENLLDNFLIGDQLAQRIRNAFDGYIFLSYRKKDWQEATRLMRLIHKFDFCRDMAIWFDDYLVPGENYNDSIQKALLKSDLFILTVTPNLVNESNYVMNVEYPLALQERIPILPIEVIPTDLDLLMEHYPMIPDTVSSEDEEALSATLQEALKHIPLGQHAGDPEHDYLIGLAYLNGVDVEVDYSLALELITSAAEAGLVEAVDKLVNICRYGQGTVQTYPTAISLQKKKIKMIEHSVSPEELAIEYLNLGDIYYKMLNYATLADSEGYRHSIMKAAEIYEKLYNEQSSLDILRRLADCYDDLSINFEMEKMYPQAKKYALKELDIRKIIASIHDTAEEAYKLSSCYFACSNAFKNSGCEEEANEFLIQNRLLLESIPQEYFTRDLWFDLGCTYADLAEMMPMRKFLFIPNQERIKLLEKAQSIFFRLYKQDEEDHSSEIGLIDAYKSLQEYWYIKFGKLWRKIRRKLSK